MTKVTDRRPARNQKMEQKCSEKQRSEWNMWRRTCCLSFFGLLLAPSAWSKSPPTPSPQARRWSWASFMCAKCRSEHRCRGNWRGGSIFSCTLPRCYLLGSSANCMRVEMQHSDCRGEFAPPPMKLLGFLGGFNIHPGQYSPVEFCYSIKESAEM